MRGQQLIASLDEQSASTQLFRNFGRLYCLFPQILQHFNTAFRNRLTVAYAHDLHISWTYPLPHTAALPPSGLVACARSGITPGPLQLCAR